MTRKPCGNTETMHNKVNKESGRQAEQENDMESIRWINPEESLSDCMLHTEQIQISTTINRGKNERRG